MRMWHSKFIVWSGASVVAKCCSGCSKEHSFAGHMLDPSLDVRLLFAHSFDVIMLDMVESDFWLQTELRNVFLQRLSSQHAVLLSNSYAGLTDAWLKLPLKIAGVWKFMIGVAHTTRLLDVIDDLFTDQEAQRLASTADHLCKVPQQSLICLCTIAGHFTILHLTSQASNCVRLNL